MDKIIGIMLFAAAMTTIMLSFFDSTKVYVG